MLCQAQRENSEANQITGLARGRQTAGREMAGKCLIVASHLLAHCASVENMLFVL